MQDRTTSLDKAAGQTVLCISIKKTQVLKINGTQNEPLTIKGQNWGGAEEDVKAKIGMASAVFAMLNKIWKSKTLQQNLKSLIVM
jgi:hypothetical protein